MPRLLLISLLVVTVARFLLGATFELSGDEAYYLQWSKRLDWSYYSKGPGIALAMWASTSLFGDAAWAVRLFAPLCGLFSSLITWHFVAQAFHRKAALWAVILLNTTPIFNVGGVIFTIDALLIPCWLGAMWMVWLALEAEQKKRGDLKEQQQKICLENKYRENKATWHWWCLAGVFLAFGFLAKYTAFVLLPSLVAWLCLSSQRRLLWRTVGPWLLLLTASLGLIPVVFWNSQNNWITIVHLLERGKIGESTGMNPLYVVEYFVHHLGVYSPLICVGSFWAILPAWRQARAGCQANGFFLICALPLLTVYFLLSLKEPGEDNWTAPAMLGLGILFVVNWQYEQRWSHRVRRRWFMGACTLGMVMVVLMLSSDLFRFAGVAWPWSRDVAGRLHGHTQTAEVIVEVVEKEFAQEEPIFLIADKWQTAASLDHALARIGDPIELVRPDSSYPRVHMGSAVKIVNQYSFWPRYDLYNHDVGRESRSHFLGANALYVTVKDRKSAPKRIRQEFEYTYPVGRFTIYRSGLPLREVTIFACRGYLGETL